MLRIILGLFCILFISCQDSKKENSIKQIIPFPVDTKHTSVYRDTSLIRGNVKNIKTYQEITDEVNNIKNIKYFGSTPYRPISKTTYLPDKRLLQEINYQYNGEISSTTDYYYNTYKQIELILKDYGQYKNYNWFWYDNKQNINEALEYTLTSNDEIDFRGYSSINYWYSADGILAQQQDYNYDTLPSCHTFYTMKNYKLEKIKESDERNESFFYANYGEDKWLLYQKLNDTVYGKINTKEAKIDYIRNKKGKITSVYYFNRDLNNYTRDYYYYTRGFDTIYENEYGYKKTLKYNGSPQKYAYNKGVEIEEKNEHGDLKKFIKINKSRSEWVADKGTCTLYNYTYGDSGNWLTKTTEEYDKNIEGDIHYNDNELGSFTQKSGSMTNERREITYYGKEELPLQKKAPLLPEKLNGFTKHISSRAWAKQSVKIEHQNNVIAFNNALETEEYRNDILLEFAEDLDVFKPESWLDVSTAYGDVNNDEMEDVIMLYTIPEVTNHPDGYKRMLAIYLNVEDGWKLQNTFSDPMLPSTIDDTSTFDSIKIENNTIVINQSFYDDCGYLQLKHRYRYEKEQKNWKLIGATHTCNAECDESMILDYNLSTGKVIAKKFNTPCDDDEYNTDSTKEIVWSKEFYLEKEDIYMDDFDPKEFRIEISDSEYILEEEENIKEELEEKENF